MKWNKGFKFLDIYLVILLSLLSNYAFSQNDTLILNNEDRIVGEIKNMIKGVLTVKTRYSDKDFKIEWLNTKFFKSNRNFLVVLSNGERIKSAQILPGKNEEQLLIKEKDKEIIATVKEIVFIESIDDHFLSRFTVSLSVGYNFTKSNNLSQFTIRSNVNYTSDDIGFTGAFNSVLSSQDNVGYTRRTDANAGFRYYIKNKKFIILSSDFLSNEDQLLNLRATIGSGLGKYLILNNKEYLATGLGVAWNNEKFQDTLQTNNNSLETFASFELNLFKHKNISLLTKLTTYLSVTEWDRVRADFNIDVKYELPLDLFIKFGFTNNFDNKPIAGAVNNDFIFQTVFGWEFK